MAMANKYLKSCVFPYCRFQGTTGLFKFPSNPEKRNEWLQICQLTSDQITPTSKICKNHFNPEDIQINSNKMLLMPGANPKSSVDEV